MPLILNDKSLLFTELMTIELTSQLQIFLDVVIATALTAFIGFEREKADKPAGIRTNMIVGGATCLIVSLIRPLVAFMAEDQLPEIIRTDPIRVLEALVVGISFIGAGTVLKHRHKVTGLTTAATLLYSSGIGICVALGVYVLSVCITMLVLVVNYIFNKVLEKYSRHEKED